MTTSSPDTHPRHTEAQFSGVAFAVAAVVLAAFVFISGVNLHHLARFVDLIEGTAHQPYVTRMLVPTSVRMVTSLIPEVWQAWVTEQAYRFPLAQLTSWLATPPDYATELLVFLVFAYAFLVGFAFGMRALARALALPTPGVIALWGLAGVMLFFRQGYIYDFSVLLTWVWMFVFAQRQQWLAYLAISVVQAVNKETALLAPLFWMVFGWRQRRTLPYWRILFVQSGIVGGVALMLRWLFRFNPGGAFEVHWQQHLHEYADNPWPILVIVGLVAIVIALAWPRAPYLVRSALFLLIPVSVLYFLFGFPYELRVYYELYPIGVICVALALQTVQQLFPQSWPDPLTAIQERILLVITLSAAFAIRILWLDQMPAQSVQDEAINQLIAQRVQFTVFEPYVGGADGGEPLLRYAQAFVLRLLSQELFAIRVLSVLSGVLTVATIYRLASDLVASPEDCADCISQRTGTRAWFAVLAASSFATALWPVAVGRLGLRSGLLPPLAMLTMLWFWRAWSRRSPGYALLSAIGLSLAFYTTIHAFWLGVVMVVFVVSSWLIPAHLRQEFAAGIAVRSGLVAVVLVTAALFSFPQILTHWQNPQLLQDTIGSETVFLIGDSSTMLGGQDRAKSSYLALFEDLQFPSYTEIGLPQRTPLPGAPLHNLLSAAFFLIGLVIVVTRRLTVDGYRLIVLWFGVMLVPALLSTAGEHAIVYLIGLSLPVALFIGAGGDALFTRLPQRWIAPATTYMLFFAVLTLNFGLTLHTFTNRWGADSPAIQAALFVSPSDTTGAEMRYPLRARFENGVTLVGYSIMPDRVPCEQIDTHPIQLTTFWRRSSADDGTIYTPRMFAHLELPDRQLQNHQPLSDDFPVAVWEEDAIVSDERVFYVPKGSAPGRAHFGVGLFWRDVQGEYQRYSILDDAGNPAADQVVLAPLMICDAPPEVDVSDLTTLNAEFDGKLRLLGMKQTLDQTADAALNVELGWQAIERMPTAYSAFVHLIDAQGQIVSQHDQQLGEPATPTSLWVPGESVRANFRVSVPPDADLGALRLRLGVYEPVSGRQLPVVVDDELQPDTFLILPISETLAEK